MSKLRLVQKINTGLIFSLIFIFLINTGFAFENNIGNISKVGVDRENFLWQKAGEFSKHNRLNCKNVLHLEYAQEQEVNSAEKLGSLAEFFLGRLAEKGKAERRIAGIGSLVLGTLCLSVGIFLLADDDSAGALLVGSGLVIDGLGIWCLKRRSPAEREFDNLLGIENVIERERVGREALFSLADKAQRGRILSAISSGALSIYFFVARPYKSLENKDKDGDIEMMEYYDVFMGSIFGALALYELINKSTEEKVLQRYLEESEKENRTGLRWGIDSGGNGKIVLLFSF